jgi:hypothetical protein
VALFPAARFQLHSVSVETSIELGYAGVVIGRVTVTGNIDEGGLFLPVPDPMPVGTKLTLKMDGRSAEARVISVVESAEPGKAGMKIQIGSAASVPGGASAPGGGSAPAGATASPPSRASVPDAASAADSARVAAPPVAAAAPVASMPAVDSRASGAEAVPEVSDTPSEAAGDGVPAADETGGNSGAVSGGGGGRRRRRRR